MVKAPDFDSSIAGSTPAAPASFGPLAQQVDHLPFKQRVRGSNPRWATTSEQAVYRLLRLFYKSQSSLIPLLLLSKSQPLRWVAIWCWVLIRRQCYLRHAQACFFHFYIAPPEQTEGLLRFFCKEELTHPLEFFNKFTLNS